MRKYLLNENYFTEIDSEDKAYFLGFLFADGYINEKNNYIELTIHEKDIEILYLFRKKLYPNNDRPILTVKNKYKRLVISSKIIVSDLVSLGCKQAKTFNLKYPPINSKFNKDFIRGYFDGDGSISITNDMLILSIVGTIEILKSIEKILIENCKLNKNLLDNRHPNRNNNIRSLRYGGNIVMNRIYHYLYDNTNYFLSRKNEIFLSILKKKIYFCNKHNYRNLHKYNIEYDGVIYNQSSLSRKLSKITGIKSTTIRKRLQNGWDINDILDIPINNHRVNN